MASITFFIQSTKNPSGIYIRLREGRLVDAKAKTKLVINPNDWSNTKGQPKNLKDENFKKLNQDLSDLKNSLLNHYNKSVGNATLNTQWLKDFINPPEPSSPVPNKILPYFDYYSRLKKNEVRSSTHSKLGTYKNLFSNFQKATKNEYFIKDVNAEFKLKFENYLKEQGYSQNTIARAFKYIKTLCYHASDNGIEINFQIKKLNIKTVDIEKIYLSPDELNSIKKHTFQQDYLDNARDWLIISCETGQRISDFIRFSKSMIRMEKNIPLLEFIQVKTEKKVALPLSTDILKILEKRGGNFPRKISEQKYNEYIKEVCAKAGITCIIEGSKMDKETNRKVSGEFPKNELVTSHIGRRSFATNYYGIIPTPLLMKATAHSTEAQFLKYIGKTDTDMAVLLAQYLNPQ